MRKTGMGAFVAILGTLWSGQGMTQTALEEIVVTAQKREQNLQHVPMSVNTASGNALQAQALAGMETLSAQLPNIHISESAIGDKLFIRGIGSGINAGFEQSVGTFIDGIHYGRSQQTRSRFLDIERIEVLRGPQSTFFGNNAIAGALNITTRRPGDSFSGYVNTFREFENNELHLEAALGGPLTETLSARVALLASRLDGWLDNTLTGETEGDEENRALRFTFAFTPTATFDATLKLEAASHETQGRNLQVLDCPPATGATGTCALVATPVLAVFGPPFDVPLYDNFDDRFDRRTQYNGPVPSVFTTAVHTLGAGEAGMPVSPPGSSLSASDRGDLANRNATLTLNWQLPGHVLTAVSGYSEYTFDFLQSSDFIPLPLGSVGQREAFNQSSQELRVVSDSIRDLEYMVGLYYQRNDLRVREDIDLYLPPPYFQPAATYFNDACRQPARGNDPACRIPATIGVASAMHDQREESVAVFGALTWHFTDSLRATVGARHARVEKNLVRIQSLQDRAPGVTVSCPQPMTGTLDCIPGTPLLMSAPNPPQGRAFGWRSGTLSLTRQDSAFTPSANLQWDVHDNVMLYASYTEGFKAGGFDQRNLFLDPVRGQFDPESVRARELGMKSLLLDGALQFNMAVFLSDYDDLQVSTFDGVVNFLVNNAASARSQGLETDFRWHVHDNLLFSGALGWLDARWRRFHDAQCTALAAATAPNATCNVNADGLLVQDLSGQDLLMSPDWSGTLALDHTLPLRNGLSLQSQLLVYAEDEKFLAADNDPATVQARFTKLNLRLALVSEQGWELAFVGRNLTGRLTSPHAEDMPLGSVNSFFRLTDRPRTYALQAQYRW